MIIAKDLLEDDMKRVVDNIKGLHREIDEMLDEKLKAIDDCMENPKECPCGEGNCEISPVKFEEIDDLYGELLKDEKMEQQFEGLMESLKMGKK